MGKDHAFGDTTAARVFDLPFEPELHTLADISEEAAGRAAKALGFARATADWRRWGRPGRQRRRITAPHASTRTRRSPPLPRASTSTARNHWRRWWSERAQISAEAAEFLAGVKIKVGFDDLCNPMLGLARDMIAAGELGEIRGYRGLHAED